MRCEQPSYRFLEVGSGHDHESVLKDRQFTNLFGKGAQTDATIFRMDSDKTLETAYSGFLRGDIAHLPFRDNSLDLVVTKDVVSMPHSIAIDGEEPISVSKAKRFRFFKEAHRVLRPGGKLVLIENNTPDAFVDDYGHMKDYAMREEPAKFFAYFRGLEELDRKRVMEMVLSASKFYSDLRRVPATSQELVGSIADNVGFSASFRQGAEAFKFLSESCVSPRLLFANTQREVDATFVAILQE